MFTFNLKLDDYVLHPVASGYAKVIPQGGREAIGRALDNVRVIPRFANNAFQLRIPQAGTEVAGFGINTPVGMLGLFDPADEMVRAQGAARRFDVIDAGGVPQLLRHRL